MMRRRMWGVLAVAVLMIAACAQEAPPPPSPIGEVTRPELVGLINWERTPATVVFRADVIGGLDAFAERNEVPPCTVYGDNRVIWTVLNADQSESVAWDIVSDETIRLFVERLTVEERIYSYTTGVDQLEAEGVQPTVERITLYVNDELHEADTYGGWSLGFFERVTDLCRSLSQAPTLFEPAGGWLSVMRVENDPSISSIRWNTRLSGVDLGRLADSGERSWVTGDSARVFWDVLRRRGYGTTFEDESGTVYQTAFEIPGVTRASPPPP
ncbi:MAG TPA: hypothetical protein PKX07_22010 [Aggregatilineales bacterium]|nr:hypothetical protein [Aggregatilineales bacterium]